MEFSGSSVGCTVRNRPEMVRYGPFLVRYGPQRWPVTATGPGPDWSGPYGPDQSGHTDPDFGPGRLAGPNPGPDLDLGQK
ncbi:Hypothetical predicted protein [Olea europaea subsp. europaea]|uniref:Uncharacterized protein n=1 Tax=Olea europaea subsp. europaea TaxID=158383 RepID=A0A8S0TC95_OLEEU|nr:Hypothetical predicted protein [Olea europaea subsp. europaea]